MTTLLKTKTLMSALAACGLAGCSTYSYSAYPAGYPYGYAQPTYGYAQPTYAPPYGAPQYATPTYPQNYSNAAATAPAVLAQQQLDQLTGPIALYPDPLLAIVLPACTYPQDISAAAAWLKINPNPTDDMINAQPWDASVKALAHYPAVLNQLAGNMDWTQALGAAFVTQQQDVMNSVQRLRAEAQTAGNLQTTQQQVVVAQPGAIEILPANPDVLFVPTYDPYLVYYSPCPVSWLSFGFGFGDFGCDWGHHRIGRGYDWRRWHDNWARHDFRDRTWTSGARPWVRDAARPAPIMPQRFANSARVNTFGQRSFDGRTFSSGNTGNRTFEPNRNFIAPNRTPTPTFQPRFEPRAPQVQPRVEARPSTPAPPHISQPDGAHSGGWRHARESAPIFTPAPRIDPAPSFTPSFREPTIRSAPSIHHEAPTFRSEPPSHSSGGGGGGGHAPADVGGGHGRR